MKISILLLISFIILRTTNLFSAPLNGTYTIGSGGNYPTINSAIADAENQGINGPVIFNIISGIYNENVSINSIPGSSLQNTLTLKSQSGNSSDVTLFALGIYSSNISIMNLSINSGYINFGLNINIIDNKIGGFSVYQTDSAQFRNNIIDGSIAYYFCGRVLIENNSIKNGISGSMSMNLELNKNNISGLIDVLGYFHNNFITGQLRNFGLQFSNNTIVGGTLTTPTMPNLSNCRNNIIINPTGGPAAYSSSYYSGSDYNVFYNGGNSNLINYGGIGYNNVQDFYNATGQDQHSSDQLVNFVSPTDLHLAPASFGDPLLIGIYDNAVTDDIDGEIRSLTNPYKGADEVVDQPLPQSTQWFQRYNGTGNIQDEGKAIAVDKSGNVYVTGYSYGSGTSSDYVTIKYNSVGIQKWIQRYNGPGNSDDQAKSIAVDDSGNVYVTGYSYGIGTSTDYTTIKYNSLGIQKWIQRYNGPGNDDDGANSLAVDPLGNIYVTGFSKGSGTSYDYTTIKYNSNGDSVWVKRYNGSANGNDQANSIAVDEFRNVYVTGISSESGTSSDFETIKYNSNGVKMWDRKYNGPGNSNDGGYSIKVDNSGNVYVTGYSFNGTYSDYATVKYNSTGVQQWAQLYNGTLNRSDEACSIAVDGLGNVYVTGQSQDSVGSYDYATLKYNSSGIQQWVKRYNGPSNSDDYGRSIACDSLSNVYVTGYSMGNGTNFDIATIKYNSSGIQQWANRYNGPNNSTDAGNSIAIDRIGNIYITGYSTGIGTSFDIVTIKYLNQSIPLLNLSALIEGFYSISTNKMIRDTVKVYIRNINSPYTIEDSAKSILDSNGKGSFNLNTVFGNLYYVVVRHRNSIETWTKQGVLFNTTPVNYDFTFAVYQAYGNNLVLKGSKYCIFGGDISQDGLIDGDDLAIIDNDAYNSLSGYVISDLNGDNFVDGTDLVIVDNNAFKFVTIVRP